jgi:acyl-CoA synthetase (NDP forming)
LREAGIPCLEGLAPGLKAVKAFLDFHLRPFSPPPVCVRDEARERAAREILQAAPGPMLAEDASKRILALYGLPVVAERAATTTEEAIAAAEALGFPVAVKALSADIAHKAQIGGVELHLGSAGEVRHAVERIRAAVAANAEGARLDGVLVQPMLRSGIELILGVKRDDQFGHMIVFGLGGVLVEAIRAFSMRKAPISETDAADMIAGIDGLERLLRKHGKGKAHAVTLIEPMLMGLSQLVQEIGDLVQDIDVNPVILDPKTGQGAVADALIVRRGPSK